MGSYDYGYMSYIRINLNHHNITTGTRGGGWLLGFWRGSRMPPFGRAHRASGAYNIGLRDV